MLANTVLWGNIKTHACWQRELRWLDQKPFIAGVYQSSFEFHLLLLSKVREQCFLFLGGRVLQANSNHLFASRIWLVSQDPHNQCYECYKCFTSQPTAMSPGSKQSWLNIHDTMAAWSHFLLSNKAPVYTVLFWASQAAVTTAFLLPVRLWIIFTDSTLIKWYAGGCAARNILKKERDDSLIMTNEWSHDKLPAHWSQGQMAVEWGEKKGNLMAH